MIYEAYPYSVFSSPDKLKLRFRRFNHNLILRERRRVARKRQADAVPEQAVQYSKQMLHMFENIGGFNGVSNAENLPEAVDLSFVICGLYKI